MLQQCCLSNISTIMDYRHIINTIDTYKDIINILDIKPQYYFNSVNLLQQCCLSNISTSETCFAVQSVELPPPLSAAGYRSTMNDIEFSSLQLTWLTNPVTYCSVPALLNLALVTNHYYGMWLYFRARWIGVSCKAAHAWQSECDSNKNTCFGLVIR